MSTTDGVNARFDLAKQAAEEVLNAMPSGSSTAVLLANDSVRGLVAEPTFDLNRARKEIREARLSDRGTALLPAIQRGIDILQRKRGARQEIYVIGDGQRQGWRQLEAIRSTLQQVKNEIHAELLFVGSDKAQNLAVTDLRLPGGLSPVGLPLSFVAQVTNYGSAEQHDVRVALRIDNEPNPVDEASIPSIKPGESTGIALTGRLRSKDYHTLTASITPDRVPADDQRTIAVRAITELNVLLVNGDSGPTAQGERDVFHQAGVAAGAAGGGGFVLREGGAGGADGSVDGAV